MKKQLHKLLLMAAPALFAVNAYAHDVEVDGIYYNLNMDNHTAYVTFGGDFTWSQQYTGEVKIPASIKHDGTVYSVTSIGEQAFSGCYDLTSVILPEGLTSIGENAFYDCYSLVSVILPEGLTDIGKRAFSCCYELTSIILPEGLIIVGNDAFLGCGKLSSIVLPESLKIIGENAFNGCEGLTSIVLPESLWEIRTYAFSGCSGLTSITIPFLVSNIGYGVFEGCSSLTTIKVSPDNEDYCSIDGILYDKEETTLHTCPAGKVGHITIPSSVTSIGYCAFSDCSGLTSITIPSSVTSIGYRAFSDCSGLTSITIPSSVTSIESSAFLLCESLATVYCSNPVPVEAVGDAFYGLPEDATLYVPQESVDAYRNAERWNEFKNILPFDFTSINGVKASLYGKAVYYDLNGCRLSAPKKGLNIVGGRKVMVK